jgi:hypothetical protein
MAESKWETANTYLIGFPLSLLAIAGLFGSLAFGPIAFLPFLMAMGAVGCVQIPYVIWKDKKISKLNEEKTQKELNRQLDIIDLEQKEIAAKINGSNKVNNDLQNQMDSLESQKKSLKDHFDWQKRMKLF